MMLVNLVDKYHGFGMIFWKDFLVAIGKIIKDLNVVL